MNNFEIIIGIEVHTILNSKTKMFSASANQYINNPNTNVCEIDLGLPGIMPQPNFECIKKGIWLANELHMNVNYSNICFDRKNYYYIDLPKGYQITQQYHPIGKDGYIEINDEFNNPKKILINRIHLEEDTAKQFNNDGYILLDYNRCGRPLIEIVSEPVIHSSYQAQQYLNELINILRFANISDAKLEDGSLRADVNISVRPYGQQSYGNKVEIKNINSVNNVKKTIDYEINRQIELLLTGQNVIQETRKYDDVNNVTIHIRNKTNAINYKYFHEPNILNIHLTDDEYKNIMNEKQESISDIKTNLIKYGLDQNSIKQLINDYSFYKIFKKLNEKINDAVLAYKWLNVELIGLLKKDAKNFEHIDDVLINNLSTMLQLLKDQEINGKQAKTILEHTYKTNNDPKKIISELGFEQIKDENVIKNILLKHMNENKEMVQMCFERPERGEKYFLGMLMKETNGQANPNISYKILKELLNNFK